MARLDLDELVEHFTLLPDEVELLGDKAGASRLGFALLLKHFTRVGRFPAGRGELAEETVEFVARQVGVPATALGAYDWSGRTIKRHRAEVRRALGFRECSVEDAEKLTEWLAGQVTEVERRPERVRAALLERCREQRLEPPTPGQVDRAVASALRRGEQALFTRMAARLPAAVAARLRVLIAVRDEDDRQDADGPGAAAGAGGREGRGGPEPSLLTLIRSEPGAVSLESMLAETDKLLAIRAIGLGVEVFDDVAVKVLEGWCAQAMVEAPSHLRAHPEAKTLTLLAALVHCRRREVTDALVDLLIATVHRIGARAERKVTEELVNAFKRVTGKENILFAIAGAAIARPDETVRDVVFPAVSGGEATLQELVHEYKTKGPIYQRTMKTTLRASYTNHYRRGLIRLLEVLEFRTGNTHRPVLDALELVARHSVPGGAATTGNRTYFPAGEHIPTHTGLGGAWEPWCGTPTARVVAGPGG